MVTWIFDHVRDRQVANTLAALFGIGFKIHIFLLLTIYSPILQQICFINDRDQLGLRTSKVQQFMSTKITGHRYNI